MDFAKRLHGLRIDYELSVKELSQKSGVSESQIRNLERGDKEPTLSTMELLAKGLNLTLFDLVYEETEPFILKSDERFLLNWYRGLTRERAKGFITYIKG
ncbi:MAG: helix-turn-helix transcriptional regulator [Ruminococcus sp.]|nr:helix-turn-helix transcriptional regulator [Ruminococcus sp.]